MIHSTLNLSQDVKTYPIRMLIWQHKEVYEAAEEWLSEYCTVGYFNYDHGASFVNGKTYARAVCFVNDTDYLIFKLKFPELCV
jgi:hypothetical protein